jgi:hypothetical protein
MPRTIRRTAVALALALLVGQSAMALPLAVRLGDDTGATFLTTLWTWFAAPWHTLAQASSTPAKVYTPRLSTKVSATTDPNNGAAQANSSRPGGSAFQP